MGVGEECGIGEEVRYRAGMRCRAGLGYSQEWGTGEEVLSMLWTTLS